MEEARQHSAVSLRVAIGLAFALCLAGCGPSARQRAQAEEEARLNAQRDADIQNLVNEAAPMRAALNQFEEQWRREREEPGFAGANEAAGETANQAGSK